MEQQITKKIEIDYGHTLPNHFGFCNQFHGHRATVEATVEGEVNIEEFDSSQGMVLDFKILKEVMMKYIHNILDHGFAVWGKSEKDKAFILQRNSKVLITAEPPTAEYLAKWAYHQIKPNLPDNIKLIRVRWYETPNGWADFQEN
jgi:6-pyruvoyltetrahydropterin/6-carboxytetrahydropterin synthase